MTTENDQTRSGAVEVTQADRDAAAEAIWFERKQGSDWSALADQLRRGLQDDHPLVQAFARHRLAATPSPATQRTGASDAEAMREALRQISSMSDDCYPGCCQGIATRALAASITTPLPDRADADALTEARAREVLAAHMPTPHWRDLVAKGEDDSWGVIKVPEALAAMLAFVRAAAQPQVPEGWKMVPVEPTNEISEALSVCARRMHIGNGTAGDAWAAVLAAAPTPGGA